MRLLGRFFVLSFVVAAATVARPVAAETAEEPLPFIADDAAYPRGVAPRLIWPDRTEAQGDAAFEYEYENGDEPDDGPALLPPRAPAFPDVSALLAPFPGAATVSEDAVHIVKGHAQAPEIERLLAAVRAGYSRDTRVEIDVTRGDERLLTFDRTTRMGALLLDDDRTDEMWPAGAEVSSVLVTPRPVVIRTGARVGVTVEPLDARRLVLDLDLHVSWVSGERAFDEVVLRRVVPIVEMIHVRTSAPLVSGQSATVQLGDVRIVIRVTREASAAPVGTRVLPLPGAAQRLAEAVIVRPRRLPVLSDAEPIWRRVVDVPRVPDAWSVAARRAGVRLVSVPPAVAIADGTETALQRFDELIAPFRAASAHVVRDADLDLSIPVLEGRPFTICVGRIVPMVTDVSVELREARALAAAQIDFEAEGRFVHGEWARQELELSVAERTIVAPLDSDSASSPALPTRADVDGPMDSVRVSAGTRSMRLRGVAQENLSASLTRLEGWR